MYLRKTFLNIPTGDWRETLQMPALRRIIGCLPFGEAEWYLPHPESVLEAYRACLGQRGCYTIDFMDVGHRNRDN